MKRNLGIASIAMAVLLCACGSDHKPSAEARKAYVEAQASALCEMKDNAYSSEAAMQKAYLGASTAGVSAEDARALTKQAEDDAQLRADITAHVKTRCG